MPRKEWERLRQIILSEFGLEGAVEVRRQSNEFSIKMQARQML